MNSGFKVLLLAAAALAVAFLVLHSSFREANTQPASIEEGQRLESEPLSIVTDSGARHQFSVEVADEPAEHAIGLMHRAEMEADHGMLFDFGATRMVQMWMKNTPLSLDMLFIDEAGTIVKIAERTTPFSLDVISSGEPVSFVLEIRGGVSRLLGLKQGDQVEHRLIGTD